jgi:hypothetical protein
MVMTRNFAVGNGAVFSLYPFAIRQLADGFEQNITLSPESYMFHKLFVILLLLFGSENKNSSGQPLSDR